MSIFKNFQSPSPAPPFLNYKGRTGKRKEKEKCRMLVPPPKKAYNPPTMPKVKSFSQVQRSSKTS